jgi:hypothetical protein
LLNYLALPMRYRQRVSAIKAHVKNGRIVVDEPTELPEGSEVQLWVVEGDDLDDAEREALHQAIRDGLADAKSGRTDDAREWAAELRSRS